MFPSLALRDYLRQRAAWVWNEQAHAFDHGLSLQEETLTEMLLLRMARDHTKHGLSVTMFSKPAEAVNGADWEWIVSTPSCQIGLRVQAKRLYYHGIGQDYGGLDLNSLQADKLITRAGSCIPVYVFYNHDHGMNSALLDAGGEYPYRGRSFWGCAVASAQAVKAAKSNNLRVLRNIMKPWHHLVTARGACGAPSALAVSGAVIQGTMPQFRRQVIERIRDRDFMLRYLLEHELIGVAVIDFSDFRG
ncbi:DUF6615 family protein [Cereibacter sphaeroides]|uniref:DUF6615 family protein n=1 Tax=Cereibacter sphaeroides TaxID=1063 RepID=UPI0039907430